MVSYTRLNVVVLSFIITFFICFEIILIFESKTNCIEKDLNNIVSNENFIENTIKNTITNETKKEKSNKTKNSASNIVKNTNLNKTKPTNAVNKISNLNMWKIVIPKINLEASIAEGTNKEIMDKYIGHFENTAKLEGNIGLAAHNRGYPVNYFQNIKKLEKGDVIQYFYQNTKKEYKVEIVTIISDTDWTYLAQTKENKITLITCVENEPNYRRCVQAVEIKKGE